MRSLEDIHISIDQSQEAKPVTCNHTNLRQVQNFLPKLGSLQKKYKTHFNRPPHTQTKSAKPIL